MFGVKIMACPVGVVFTAVTYVPPIMVIVAKASAANRAKRAL